MMSSVRTPEPPVPASWLIHTVRIKPGTLPIGHSIRSAIVVGVPFIIGALTNDALTWMWVGLAGLLLSAGEREGTYRLNFLIIAVSTPIAAAGFLFGFIQHTPLALLAPLMAIVAFVAGLAAGLGAALSVASMQFLLIATIGLGIESTEWWRPFGLYILSGLGYAALLAVELLLNPNRPQKIALTQLLQALHTLARARSEDLRDGGNRTATARLAATTALLGASTRTTDITMPRRHRRTWVLDSDVTDAAEKVAAALLSEVDANSAENAERILGYLSDSVTGQASSSPDTGGAISPFLRKQLTALDTTLHPAADDRRPRHGSTSRQVVRFGRIDREVTLAAVRLAICFGVAITAVAFYPSPHWFWVPLTVCLVMKPDFGSVFSRAVLRVLGTAVGVALATLVLVLVPKGIGVGIVMGLVAACIPSLMPRSYALQAVTITPIVILLIDQIQPGHDEMNAGWQRFVATLLGSAIVLVFGYLCWPRSRRAWAARTFASALTSIADQLRSAAHVAPTDPKAAADRHEHLIATRREAYSSLALLRTRMERALSEPPPTNTTASTWLTIAARTEHLADAVTVYSITRHESGPTDDDPPAASWADALSAIADGERPPLALPADAALQPVKDDAEELSRMLSLGSTPG